MSKVINLRERLRFKEDSNWYVFCLDNLDEKVINRMFTDDRILFGVKEYKDYIFIYKEYINDITCKYSLQDTDYSSLEDFYISSLEFEKKYTECLNEIGISDEQIIRNIVIANLKRYIKGMGPYDFHGDYLFDFISEILEDLVICETYNLKNLS